MECGLVGEVAWVRTPLPERMLTLVVRATMWRANRTAMRRLAAELTRHVSAAGG